MPVLPLVASITVWPGFSSAVALGGLDDAERQPVLDRAERVERLELGEELDAFRREPREAHDRRVADRLEDGVIDPGHLHVPFQCLAVESLGARAFCPRQERPVSRP